jgi:hypothetical protein
VHCQPAPLGRGRLGVDPTQWSCRLASCCRPDCRCTMRCPAAEMQGESRTRQQRVERLKRVGEVACYAQSAEQQQQLPGLLAQHNGSASTLRTARGSSRSRGRQCRGCPVGVSSAQKAMLWGCSLVHARQQALPWGCVVPCCLSIVGGFARRAAVDRGGAPPVPPGPAAARQGVNAPWFPCHT